ncbi:MAG: hypothetical protein K1X88_21500 [Nannocystaceae bacterium]|nr:hypothetical protein [Nannocystaceae bacterium]
MKRLVVLLTLPAFACTGRLAVPAAMDPSAAIAPVAARADTLDTLETPPPAPPPAAPETVSADDDAGVTTVPPAPDLLERPDRQRTRNGLFWTGVALAAIGGAAFVGTAVGGRVTQAQLDKGYRNDDLTIDRESTLRDRGKGFNIGASVTGSIALVGIALLAIVYGVDYARCGTIAKRRKDCRPR